MDEEAPPGRIRPIKYNQCVPASLISASASRNGSVLSGRKKSGGLLRRVSPKNPGGVIPTTVNGFSSILNTLPMTDGSDPYLSCHNLWLITATGGAPGRSSAE